MENIIESKIFDIANTLRSKFSYEEYTDLCIYFIFLKYVLDNEKLSYDKDTFALQRMFDRGELNEEALYKVSRTLEKQYKFPPSSLVDLVESYLRVSERYETDSLTNNMMGVLENVSFKNQSEVVVKGIVNLLYSAAYSFGRIMGEKISKKSIALLVKFLIELKDGEKFADFAYGFGISTLEITKGIECEITGYEINRSSVAIGIILLVILEKENFIIHMQDTLKFPIEEESFDKIVTIPPLGMKVYDEVSQSKHLLEKFDLPSYNYNLEVYMILNSILALKEQGKAIITVSSSVLFMQTKAAKSIRKLLVEKYLQAVVQLPALYYGTSVSTVMLILKKDRISDQIQFIDAATNKFFVFSENTKKNHIELTDSGIQKIIQIYQKKQDVEGISFVADTNEIEQNEFSLVPEKYIKVKEVREYISNDEIDQRLQELYGELKNMIQN